MLRLLALWALVVTLAGCAGQPAQISGNRAWAEHVMQLQAFNHWRASGKLAVRSVDQSESASLVWQQEQANTSLTLSGPRAYRLEIPVGVGVDRRWV